MSKLQTQAKACATLENGIAGPNRVDSREVGSFVPIAPLASQRQVAGRAGTSMLDRDDMLDMMREHGEFLGQQAILAAVFRSAPDAVPRRSIHRWVRFSCC